uniref:Putative rhodoquinone biosynthesis methyltransferase-like protein RQUA n=1 Tax=Pygsuia biforma TaxID=1277256 RepID=A0A0K0MD65_9EUKA|nr:putative rhodoquinone biosynthesis methyltransferase-like protein RQUA [Pygsuia biforma]|eukprot:GCRY01000773.1.p1 GENE.GCRY01000773.1~~GCRY01000773.1.p1  ORF type:complete len:273 (+),score=24.21 GCRY01000773.1:153-971(+)
MNSLRITSLQRCCSIGFRQFSSLRNTFGCRSFLHSSKFFHSTTVRGNDKEELPEYMANTYHWAYVNPRNVALLDNNFVVNTILFGNYIRIQNFALSEIKQGDQVFMPASVYGSACRNIAKAVGEAGRLDIIDISPIQVVRNTRKLSRYPQVTVLRGDARSFDLQAAYDVACSFMLLHEIPDENKSSVVNNVLNSVKVGGKAVFIDYGRPSTLHPVRPILSFVNDWLEPWAKTLWAHPISSFAAPESQDHFVWETERTIFGGVYQKVVAHRIA